MKRLESVRVVQFFLFEKEELRIQDITGLFGRNGSGKSAFLDAVQIAMLGANSNLMAFNAQADDRTTRSIRSYCLGQYGPEDQRARDNATTYITLVWRDTSSNEVISMGVCLSATASDEKHTVVGRYIARGVDILMTDHLETIDGVERPRDWRAFRVGLQERSARITGNRDVCFEDGKQYIKEALFALRGSGGVPAYEAYTRAFRFALRMRFDKSVDHIVRHDVLESRPTDVKKFRLLTDTFSKLNSMVAYVEKKIDDGGRVVNEFSAALTETRRAATWGALNLGARGALASEEVSSATDKKDAAEESLAALSETHVAMSGAVETIELELDDCRNRMEAHSAHKDFALAQTDRVVAEERARVKRGEVTSFFGDVRKLLDGSSTNPCLAEFHREISEAVDSFKKIGESIGSLSSASVDSAVRPAMKLASRISSHLLTGPMRHVASQLEDVERDIETVTKSIQRIGEGKAPLSEPAQSLLSELRDNGLLPVPVCDVVSVSDPQWQPVIEGFLARNVEALLVDRHEEAKAFSVYRQSGGRRAIYGVKIAMASQQKVGEVPRPGSVAELIEGTNPAAVAYLRRQFGDLMRADTDGEALAGGRTLTKDGMLVGRGAFERIELVRADRLKLGIADTKRGSAHEEQQLVELNRRKDALSSEGAVLKALFSSYSNLASESILQWIRACIVGMQEADSDLAKALVRIGESTDAEYQELCSKVADLTKKLPLSREEERKVDRAVIEAQAALKAAIAELEQAGKRLEEIGVESDAARAHPDFDQEFFAEHWDRLLSRFDEDYSGMAAHCADQARECGRQAERASRKATASFTTYLVEYRESPGQDICDDWRKSAAWIGQQVKRLHDTELLEHKERANEAYKASQEAFRTDVALALNERFDHLDHTVARLNAALKDCPLFSNGERYQFVRAVRPDLKFLMRFVKDVAAYGGADDLFGGAGDIPPEFEALLREKVAPGAAGETSPLDDYREFFEFDIEIRREDPVTGELKPVGMLSKRLGAGSGGEHRSPLYVIAGAALASAYRLDKGNRDGISLILLDEAFDKMDVSNLTATMRYLEELGLQVLLASPGENQGALNAFMHRYYDVQHDVDSHKVEFEGHTVSAEMRAAYREDLPEFNPDLIKNELEAMRRSSEMAA